MPRCSGVNVLRDKINSFHRPRREISARTVETKQTRGLPLLNIILSPLSLISIRPAIPNSSRLRSNLILFAPAFMSRTEYGSHGTSCTAFLYSERFHSRLAPIWSSLVKQSRRRWSCTEGNSFVWHFVLWRYFLILLNFYNLWNFHVIKCLLPLSSLVKQSKRTGDVALPLVFVLSANAKCLGNGQWQPINSSNTYFQCLVHIHTYRVLIA